MNLQFALLTIVTTTIFTLPMTAIGQTSTHQQKEVEQMGKKVMPFDLDQTLHIFSKTQQGGVQQVISKKASNKSQILLIQTHLKKIAHEFSQGNFTDPIRIHGENMPGLATLKKATTGEINIKYRVLEDGAEVSYSTTIPSLVRAIHQWFDAQLNDHAQHAVTTQHKIMHTP